jgi:AcrR family transcriptional regulator
MITPQAVTKAKSAKRPPPKPYHHGDLHQEILCAACDLIEDNNIASLSLREVAKKVGVSHTAPYRHFKDKESLLAGIAGVGFKQLAKQIAGAVESNHDNPAAQLQAAGHGYVQLAMNSPQCTQLMFSGILPCDDTYPELRASGDLAFGGLKMIIEQGQASGVFKKGDVETMALAAWASIHGLALLLISGNLAEILSISVDTRQITDAVTSTMLEGLKSS